MAETPNYITPNGLEKLKAEYGELFHSERPRLVETVAWAASNGDRSENGDYIYGKKRLREIDRRLRYLRKKIENAEVVDPTQLNSDKVVFGATIYCECENGEQHHWKIVGEDESNPSQGEISWKSPIARALLGKKIGDDVRLRRPKGDLDIEITDIIFK